MAGPDRDRALDTALAQIERQYGKGSIMRLGDEARAPVAVIPTGSIALDVALGIGGLPRGRVVEIFGPEASGKTTVALHAVAQAQAAGGIAAFIDAEHALDPDYAKRLGVDTDALLVAQPDTGEQALEIADMLIRSGALDVIVIDSVAALVPRAEIEGEMGDSHVGLQARLMSQALRKITGALNNSGTTAIFINQLREKIGVLFGCLSFDTKVTLADGRREKIGKLVSNKLPVQVLSYDPEIGQVVPKQVVNWFDNGPTEEFLQMTVARGGSGPGRGRARIALTRNHLVGTPGGWRAAGELSVGDRVMLAQPHRLSPQQWQVVLGGLMGDGALSEPVGHNGGSARFRMGHASRQTDYIDWKATLFGNIGQSRTVNAKNAVFVDLQPLPELAELRQAVYVAGRKVLSWEYLKALTPLAIAVWYMDDGSFTNRSKGLQGRTRAGSGRSEICVQALSEDSRRRLVEHLAGAFDLHPTLCLKGARQQAVLIFAKDETAKLHALIAPYVHPSMQYKLLERYRGQFTMAVPEFTEPRVLPVPARVVDIRVKPPTRSMHRFDIEVEGSHNYLADGIVVHNSPETTTGGRALKFYASIRLDVRRIETLKDGTEAIGSRTRVKVVKNKCLAEGTLVFDPTTGVTHRIEDIVGGRLPVGVVAVDKTGQLHVRQVVSWFDQGVQDTVRLKLRGGAELRVTPDHKVLTETGWREAGRLRPGDRVAQPLLRALSGDRWPIPEQASSQSLDLPIVVSKPVFAHLRRRGLTAAEAARILGRTANEARGGLAVLLGAPRLRRDRLAELADALDDAFLRDVLSEQLVYSALRTVESAGPARTFDVEVDELHNLVADHVVVHNCAPPFKQAEFDIVYGHGISREGSLIDVGVEHGIVRKSGAWYTYEGDQLGQGKENARAFLRDNPDLADEIDKRIKEKLGVGPALDAPAPADLAAPPVDF